MSNTRKAKQPPPQNPVSALLAANDGIRVPGGCDHCDAYQEIRAHYYGKDIHMVAICHDDDCPRLAAIR